MNFTSSIEELIFFVTSRCNMKCGHCFISSGLNTNDDLELKEITSIAETLNGLKTLNMSGGEPFLRKDLVEICRIFSANCALRCINIPTNGYLSDIILAAAGEICNIAPEIAVSIRISLDGLEKYHDVNRGMKGAFDHAVRTISELSLIKNKHNNLKVDVVSTLNNDNSDQIISLYDFTHDKLLGIDNFYWGVLRGTPKEKNITRPSPEILGKVDNILLEKLSRDFPERYFMNSFNRELYAVRQAAFQDRGFYPCVAGRKIIVIYSNGELAPCEMLPPVGNIRENPLKKILEGSDFQKRVNDIVEKRCICTHECFLFPSLVEFYKKNKFRYYRKYAWPLIKNKLYKFLP